MLTFANEPITVLAVVLTVREWGLASWGTVAFTVLCILAVGFAVSGEFRRRENEAIPDERRAQNRI